MVRAQTQENINFLSFTFVLFSLLVLFMYFLGILIIGLLIVPYLRISVVIFIIQMVPKI